MNGKEIIQKLHDTYGEVVETDKVITVTLYPVDYKQQGCCKVALIGYKRDSLLCLDIDEVSVVHMDSFGGVVKVMIMDYKQHMFNPVSYMNIIKQQFCKWEG